jgi:hypothetical protein
MTTYKNLTGSKAVNITNNEIIRASYVQFYNNEEQVLQVKTFATLVNAKKWAIKILNITNMTNSTTAFQIVAILIGTYLILSISQALINLTWTI